MDGPFIFAVSLGESLVLFDECLMILVEFFSLFAIDGQLSAETYVVEIQLVGPFLESLLVVETVGEFFLDLEVAVGLDDAVHFVRIQVGDFVGGEETGEELQPVAVGLDALELALEGVAVCWRLGCEHIDLL